ncbi:MAG TPA: hypothetical protein VHP37_20065 [Burkholderiales bacterium]|nr:hypothetical protein [Burkholderiales bacterium]
MQNLRRLFAWTSRDALSRLSCQRLLSLFLVVVVPGGLVVPICYGLYGALRLTLSGKAATRVASRAAAPAVAPSARGATLTRAPLSER